jgi:hypothetical protein
MTKTFKYDHIVRDKKGKPLGRIVLVDDNYLLGEPLKVILLKLPRIFFDSVLCAELYLDGVKYKVPSDLSDFRINSTSVDWVISNFILEVDNNGS